MKHKTRIALILAIILCLGLVNAYKNVLTKGKLYSGIYVEAVDSGLKPTLNDDIRAYLESKKSPLASHTDLLLKQKHWKLLIAISAIESQYCKRQLGNNCWGIGNDSNYKYYDSIDDAIVDADSLITWWQAKGRWLTIADFNCHYVVPCNENWVNVVNQVLEKLNAIENKNLQMRTKDME